MSRTRGSDGMHQPDINWREARGVLADALQRAQTTTPTMFTTLRADVAAVLLDGPFRTFVRRWILWRAINPERYCDEHI